MIGRATPQSEAEAVRKKLHSSYVGASVVKQFGHLGWFTGVVQEVWEHEENGFFANIYYTDGDSEDVPIKELEGLMKQTSLEPHINWVGVSSYATRSEQATPEIQQPTELSFVITKKSEKLKDDNIDGYVPYPTKSMISQNALGQPPSFTDLSEPIAPFGVTLSDLTHMVMVDIPNIRHDNSFNCDNSTPKGMHVVPLLSSTVHHQHRKSLDCNAFSSLPSARDDSETEWSSQHDILKHL